MKRDIRICGLGGQGVIMSGMIIGRGAAIHEDRHATLIQSFGPEARGSTVSAQVIVSDDPIPHPYIRRSDVLMAFGQSAYDKFVKEMNEDSILVYEEELVAPDDHLPKSAKRYGIPGTRLAEEEMGRRIAFNMVMTGFFTAVTGIVDAEAMRKAVADAAPTGTEELNVKAFELGYRTGIDRRSASLAGFP